MRTAPEEKLSGPVNQFRQACDRLPEEGLVLGVSGQADHDQG